VVEFIPPCSVVICECNDETVDKNQSICGYHKNKSGFSSQTRWYIYCIEFSVHIVGMLF